MPVNMEDYIRLLETMVEQQKIHIQSQDARILEQEQAIAQLRALVDELRLLKSGLEETLEEFKRQLFGTKSPCLLSAMNLTPSPPKPVKGSISELLVLKQNLNLFDF